MKGYYTSEFLYISSICFSKLPLLVLFYTVVSAQRTHRRVVLGFGFFIVAWSIASIVAVAFQCELPRPWEIMTLQCFNTVSILQRLGSHGMGANTGQRLFWVVYCIIDMSTEICIIMVSLNMVVYLRLRSSRKIAVVACFAPRALVAAAALVRLIWLYPITPHDDPEYRLWLPAILSEVHVCLSVCTACIPFMVPFFRSIDTGRRRTHLSKFSDYQMDDKTTHPPSSLWFRRQRRTKIFNSWDSTAVASLQYERVSHVSPHIPTPRPMSPLTPPRYNSRPGTAKSSSSTYNGLSISIPDWNSSLHQNTGPGSPQTASSCALSPSCTSPTPLIMMNTFVSPRKAPTPPTRTHSPNPPTASSQYSSNNSSPMSPGRAPRFSLFPQHHSPTPHPSPGIGHSGFAPISVPPIRSLRPTASGRVSRNSIPQRPYDSSSGRTHVPPPSARQPPKFSTGPDPTSPPSTTTSATSNRRRHVSVQELNSPMGAAINNYFRSAVPEHEPAASTIAHRERNHQILSPANALRTQTILPHHPPGPSHNDIMYNELRLPRNSFVSTKALRSPAMPPVQDKRSSPRLVVREPY
jgi:hypothetical protein